jgi:hypothetical protein
MESPPPRQQQQQQLRNTPRAPTPGRTTPLSARGGPRMTPPRQQQQHLTPRQQPHPMQRLTPRQQARPQPGAASEALGAAQRAGAAAAAVLGPGAAAPRPKPLPEKQQVLLEAMLKLALVKLQAALRELQGNVRAA